MTITNAMTALQLHNSKIPLDQRYSAGQVAERLMSAVGKASRQLLNECNNEIDAAPAKWTYKIATTDPTSGVVTYVRELFGIVAWLNRTWGDNLKAGHIGRHAAVKHLKNPLVAQEAMAARPEARVARVHRSFAEAGPAPTDMSLSLQSLELAGVSNAVTSYSTGTDFASFDAQDLADAVANGGEKTDFTLVEGLSVDKVPMVDGLCNNYFGEAHHQAKCPSPVIRQSLAKHKELVAAILDKKKVRNDSRPAPAGRAAHGGRRDWRPEPTAGRQQRQAQLLKFARVACGAGDDDDPVSDDEQHEYTAHAASSASAADCFSLPVPTFHYSEDEDVCENYLGEAVHRACYVCAVEPEIDTEIAVEPEIEVEIEDEVDAEIEAEAEVPERAVPRAARLRQAFVSIMRGLGQGVVSAALAGMRHETAEFALEDALAWDAAEARVLGQALSDRAHSGPERMVDVPHPREDVPHPQLELPIDIDIAAVEAEIEIEIEAKIGIEIRIEAKAPEHAVSPLQDGATPFDAFVAAPIRD